MSVSMGDYWDYSALAANYDSRPGYSVDLVHQILLSLDLGAGQIALEVGAGTGKLTAILLNHGLDVTAVEPNSPMRNIALAKPWLRSANWLAGRGEALPLRSSCARLVAYGSSFNVLPIQTALDECARVLQTDGVWLALWNHRDLDDPLQAEVESVIRQALGDFDYGRRRRSPASDLQAHGAFVEVRAYQRRFEVDVDSSEWLQAWRSHATLQRQAGKRFAEVVGELTKLVQGSPTLRVPYYTRAWSARRRKS